jgi:hypothetical protein
MFDFVMSVEIPAWVVALCNVGHHQSTPPLLTSHRMQGTKLRRPMGEDDQVMAAMQEMKNLCSLAAACG